MYEAFLHTVSTCAHNAIAILTTQSYDIIVNPLTTSLLTYLHTFNSLCAFSHLCFAARRRYEAMMNHLMSPEELLREFPYEFQEMNPFTAAPTSADDAIKLYENGELAVCLCVRACVFMHVFVCGCACVCLCVCLSCVVCERVRACVCLCALVF